MDKITERQLIEKGVRNVDYEGDKYFLIIDINALYPYVKYTPLNVRVLKYESEEMKFVKANDIEPMTEFDKKILSAANSINKK
jgi:hypothetical protein